MKNGLTRFILFSVATVSLYTIIQVANLAVTQPRRVTIGDLVQHTAYATLPASFTAQNMPIGLPMPTVSPVAQAVAPQIASAATALIPAPTVPTAIIPPTAVILPTATQTPVPLLKMTPVGGAVAASSAPVAEAPAAQLDAAQPAIADLSVAEPVVQAAAVGGCGTPSTNHYTLIPMEVANNQRPDSQHGDLNLGLRGYQPIAAAHEFVSYNGDSDAGAPQGAGLFADRRHAAITSVYQVRDWQWDCGGHGCAADWLTHYDVTLMGVATSPGEAIAVPSRGAEVYGGGYVAVVLYAEAKRLTVAYTRDGSVANGYTVHLENLCVDPNLLAQYWAGNAGGRHQLPGLRNGETVGTAASGEVLIAMRDRGTFMDPRSRNDWWR